ncbi:MAG TPA: glycerophosphodiester phosphodiesterase [Methylomirabilota bacterium]|nr:glycerophosphodiester phosphodiesterase [Methylomirabilota bacterium]
MKIIGHRGARGLAPENTIASLKKGLEHHVDMLEFDLRVTQDGIVILHHDPDLTDPNGKQQLISETSYSTLKNHKKDLATFEEVLDEIGHPVTLYVEVKPGEPTAPIIKIIKSRLKDGWKPEHFRLASFSQPILLELHDALPDITKTVLEKWSGVRAVYRAKQVESNHLLMNQRWLWWGFIAQMTRRGYKIGAYTVNNPAQAKRWQRYGLRAIVTDYPDRFEK